jgi:type I restriction enzyme S subunit
MSPQDQRQTIVEILGRQAHLKARRATIRQANDALIPATLELMFSGIN